MRNRNQKGFTLIELVIVIAIIAILAAVLIPNLLGARARANDAAAFSVARQVATASAAMQVNNPLNTISGCSAIVNGLVTVTSAGAAGPPVVPAQVTTVPAPAPVTLVTCAPDGLSVVVAYSGGTLGGSVTVAMGQ